jgi:hypothetical protein
MNLKSGLQKNQSVSYESKDGGFVRTCFSLPDGMEVYKPKSGVNKFDILPFIRQDGSPAYMLDYYQHKDVGLNNSREICLFKTYGKPCPVCEERARLLADGAKYKDPAVKALAPSRRCLYNVIDLQEPEKGIQIFEVSHYIFEKILIADAYDDDPEMVFADLEDGRTISFKGRNGEGQYKEFVSKFDSFTFLPRNEGYSEDILKQVVQLDRILTPKPYDVLQSLFYGNPVPDEEEDEEEDGEALVMPFESPAPAAPVPKPKAKAEAVTTCPIGVNFGKDYNQYEECDECPVRKKCRAAQ